MQEGTIALLHAYRNYDPEKASLGTYATWVIRSKLREHVIKVSTAIHGADTDELRTAFFKIRSGEVNIWDAEEVDTLADKLNVTKEALYALHSPLMYLDDTEKNYHEFIGGDYGVEASTIERVDMELVAEAIKLLPERYQLILDQWFYKELTFDQIALNLGCSRAAVHDMKNAAIHKLRCYFYGTKLTTTRKHRRKKSGPAS